MAHDTQPCKRCGTIISNWQSAKTGRLCPICYNQKRGEDKSKKDAKKAKLNAKKASLNAQKQASGNQSMDTEPSIQDSYGRMHWLYFLVIWMPLGMMFTFLIIPLCFPEGRGFVKKAYGYW